MFQPVPEKMDSHELGESAGAYSENTFDIGSIMQQHLRGLWDEIQGLVSGGSRRTPSMLSEPYQWNQYLLDQDLDEWGRDGEAALDLGDENQDKPKPSTAGFFPQETLGETLPSSRTDSVISAPPDFLGLHEPKTSTPIEKEPPPLLEPKSDRDKVLPIEYMGPHFFPTLKHGDLTTNVEIPSVARAGVSQTVERVSPTSGRTDLEVFRAEYERMKKRLENRRRAEREALARLISSESSSQPEILSADKLRTSLNNLSQILDEMADLLNINVAEASASEVQERAEALWGREVAAQLSEEYSREMEASKSDKSKHSADEQAKTPLVVGDESRTQKSGLQLKTAKEPFIHRSNFPLLGPRDIGYERDHFKQAKGRTKKDVHKAGPSKRTTTSSSSRSRTAPLPRTSEVPPKDSKTEFRSRRLRLDDGKGAVEEGKVSSAQSVPSSSWKVSSEIQEGMSEQRVWKFEESTNEDALDKMKQRRAEICRTTIGSLPSLQKVASVRLLKGPQKKARKLCTLKIVGIVTPLKETSMSSATDAPGQEEGAAPAQATREKEPRWEASFM